MSPWKVFSPMLHHFLTKTYFTTCERLSLVALICYCHRPPHKGINNLIWQKKYNLLVITHHYMQSKCIYVYNMQSKGIYVYNGKSALERCLPSLREGRRRGGRGEKSYSSGFDGDISTCIRCIRSF